MNGDDDVVIVIVVGGGGHDDWQLQLRYLAAINLVNLVRIGCNWLDIGCG